MEWASCIAYGAGGWRALIEGAAEGEQSFTLASLSTRGLPDLPKLQRKRLRFDGSFETWTRASHVDMLTALGLSSLPDNRHHVFQFEHEGLTVFVPALAVIRALFKPASVLFRLAFTPLGVDLISHVDWSQNPPTVVIDCPQAARVLGRAQYGARQIEALRWMQTSRSARSCVQSTHTYALAGQIGLDLPTGHACMAFHGVKVGRTFFATQMSMNAVEVAEEDSLTGKAERFCLHASQDKARAAPARDIEFNIPPKADGTWELSEAEWGVVAGLLLADNKRRIARADNRSLVDAILVKLGTKCAWSGAPAATSSRASDPATYFHRWCATRRFQRVVEFLAATRRAQVAGQTAAQGAP